MSTETLSHSSRTSPITFGTPARVATKLCGYCGWNIEEQDLEILSFFLHRVLASPKSKVEVEYSKYSQ